VSDAGFKIAEAVYALQETINVDIRDEIRALTQEVSRVVMALDRIADRLKP